MCCPLHWVMRVQNLQPANVTHVAMEIGACVAVVTLASRRVRAKQGLMGYVGEQAGCG